MKKPYKIFFIVVALIGSLLPIIFWVAHPDWEFMDILLRFRVSLILTLISLAGGVAQMVHDENQNNTKL